MENETSPSREGHLEPLLPGSVTFDDSILEPLRNNYLYKESRECFTYNFAYLINNTTLQQRYAAFRAEKQEKGYSDQELEESFGFLLFNDANRAKNVGKMGLSVGQAKCTTLGDSLKGVYISKYSDCLDLKRWYDGKTGYIIIFKITKGRVKEVTDNYTQNFTPPTTGFDCHISEQLHAVSSTTSSFLAYERAQYYMYEINDGSSKTEPCPRHVCPFAIVAFSYGKSSTISELEEKSQEKTVFHYQPWIGQLKIESAVYDVGLQSTSGAWFPAKLPKTVKIDHAIGVSELKRTLPREIFETSLVGEVCIDGRCFNLYDVVSSEAKNDLAQITQELKEKDMALVIPLDDSGFLILLHSSHLFSYEDAKAGKAEALQGMFIFPDSRAVPRDTKCGLAQPKVSTDVMHVIPALNYAETEMEKCPSTQQGAPRNVLEKQLQSYATLIHPGLLDIPTREASMFPDQYDVPGGFTLIAPKWTQETGTRLKSYFDEPCGFTIPVVRALELLAAGRQQRGDEHDDDIYYCIPSPDEPPQMALGVTEQTETVTDGHSASDMADRKVADPKDEHKHISAEQPQPALQEVLGTPGTAIVTVADNATEYPNPTVSPKLGDVPTEHCVSIDVNVEKTSQFSTEGCGGVSVDSPTKDSPIHTSTPLTISKEECDASGGIEENIHPEKTMTDPAMKEHWRSLPRRRGRKRKMHWKTMQAKRQKELALQTSSLPQGLPENATETVMKDLTKDQIESDTKTESLPANNINQRPHLNRGRGRRRRGVNRYLSKGRQEQAPFESTALLTSESDETIHEQSMNSEPLKTDWRSLPRRKKLWNTDVSLKRFLRSDTVKTSDNDSLSGEASFDATDGSLSSAPKRKMEGLNMRERYGLKNIITECGRVFVPHGSDVASGDAESLNNGQSESTNDKEYAESSIDTNTEIVSPVENKCTEIAGSRKDSPSTGKEKYPSKHPMVNEIPDTSYSPSKDKPSVHSTQIKPLVKHHKNHQSNIYKCQQLPPEELQDTSIATTSNEAALFQDSKKDHSFAVDEATSPPKVPELSMNSHPKASSPEKIKKKSKHVYSAISISKLKTVLRRGRKTKSPSTGDNQISELDNAEPVSKKGKSGFIMDQKLDNIRNNELKDKRSHSISDESHQTSLSEEGHESMKTFQTTKQPASWRGLIRKSSKENGSLNFDTSAPYEIVNQADQQLTGDRVGRTRISSDGKGSTERLTTATSLPSDALSLLADLALGASNDKILGNQEAKPGQETPAGVKGDGSPESVLHALLRCPTSRFKLPPRSPFPEGLLVTGELILEISKEHSYSQPTSLLSGLSGPCPQVPPQIGCVESPLSLKTGLHLNLPRDTVASFYQEEGGKTEWKSLISPNMPFQSTKTKTRRSRILRDRQIMDKKGSIEVTRIWRETYEFKYDSKFTNDSLDKTVTRALHGKWNFNIEDTYEEVHLIFHMWIGLFYSKNTSRLFHLENSTAFPKRKESAEVQQDIDSLSNAELNSKQSAASALRVPEVLDLSVKNSEPVNLQSVLKDTRDEIASHPGVASAQKLDTAPRHSPSGTSPSPGSHPIASLMNYRSAVDILKENSVPENEDDIDEENDTTADCSYTQLLEGNSAYNQLCEHTSNMTISIRQCVPMAKIINVSKNKAPIRMTTFEAKEIGVFHQVISPIKPSAFSKRHGLILGRKSFELNFMDKIENAAPLTLEQENMSENAENKVVSDAHRTQDSCPVTICDGNVGKTIEIKTKEVVQTENISETKDKKVVSDDDSQDGLLKTGRNGENVEKNTMSEISCKEQTSITDHSSDHTSDAKGKPFLYLDDQTNMSDHVDELKDTSSHETGVEEQNEIVELNAEEELKPLLNLKGHSNEAIDEERDVSSHDVEGNNTKEHVKKGVEYSTNEEKMQEEQNIKQSKSQEETKPDGKHSECEISTTMVEHLDESVMGLNDEIGSDSMEISDEDVDNTAQIEVHEANTSNIEVFPAEPLIQKSETQPKTPEVHHVEANTEDGAHKEPNNIPCPSVVKHKSASTLDTYNVIKYGVDRMNLEQSIVVQEGVHDICQDESETESNNNLEIINLEEAEERDISQQDADETISDDTHGNEAQTQMSDIREDKTQVIYTFQNFQKPEFPKMCASPPVCTNLYDKNLAQQASAVCRSSEVKENSNCSTPTQDEIPYDLKVNKAFVEVSNFKDDSNRDLKCINNMIDPGVTMLSPKSPLSPRAHVCTKLPVSNTIEHCKEAHSKEPGWRRSKYPSTSDFDKFTLITEHSVPHQFKHKLYSTSQHRDDGDSNFIDGTTQDDSELFYRDYDSGHLHGYYHKCPSDQGVLWTDGKTDGSNRHRGSYPCEKDSDDDSEPPFHYMYNTSEFGDDSYWQKNVTEKDTFKCQTKVTTAAKYGTTIEILERDRTLEKSSRNNKSTGTFYCKREWHAEESSDCIADYSIKKTSHFKKYRTKPTRTVTVSSTLHDGASKQRFDWRRYFRREATFRQLFETNEVNNKFDMPPSSIVTIFDKEGNRVTYENSPTMKTSTGTNSRTIKLENSLNHWRNQQSKADVTRSAVDYEYLIFSEKLNGILKESKRSFSTTSHFRSNTDHATLPMTVRFSDLEEQESSIELSKAQTSLTEFKIKVDLSNKKVIREPLRNNKPFHLQRLFCEKGNEVECSRISEIAEQCASSYKSMMNDICAGKTLTHQSEAIKWKWSQNEDSLTGRQQSGFCGPIKKDMFDCLHNNLNSVVRQACKTKYRFYILVTSADPFFEETKNLLVIEGHIPVEPDEFNLNDNRLSPLLIILRNEDIAQHICEVPYLLELKKSSCVQFAGIDRPDDVVNLTHQELFAKGGYVVCDGTALDKLTLDNMKKVVGILEELDKKGKWKWFLHYKDSRKLRENARSSYEASKKQNFIDCCQEAGLVEVLPYHDCDVISREQPDYLSCLIRLQIQNASVRFPVFITDTPADSFGKNGILTMNIYTFSRILSNDTCSVS